MLKMPLTWNVLAFAGVFAVAGAFVGCSSDEVAGGISEETNTVAGILVSASGKPVAGVPVLARHIAMDSVTASDTTDSKGRFDLQLKVRGQYGIFAQDDSTVYYELVDFQGEPLEVSAKLDVTGSVSGTVQLRPDSVAAGIKVYVPGADIWTETDEDGDFRLDGIPMGVIPVLVESPDAARFSDAVYVVDVAKPAEGFFGPIPAAVYGKAEPVLNVEPDELLLPLSPEYALLGSWSEPSGVVEDEDKILEGSRSLTLETWVNIASVDGEKYRRNIVGKFADGSSGKKGVFSLALIDGECGAGSASLAFFVGNENGDSMSCGNAAIAEFDSFDEWVYVAAVWDGKIAVLYVNGDMVAEKHVSAKQIGNSSEPFIFGSESMDFKLDDVRVSASAITGSDVLFRYYLKGGAYDR